MAGGRGIPGTGGESETCSRVALGGGGGFTLDGMWNFVVDLAGISGSRFGRSYSHHRSGNTSCRVDHGQG